ncbi:MAG: tRNA (guanosine(37)-N1)-methyltransferase TrmD [Acidimicrobiaceae bacterium]|nr:tRNA (guanosine(37)-N1)-methyltransferase TrmD [Acidimicrobiaceae bacterium]
MGLRVDIFTIFPEPVEMMASLSVIGRARTAGVLDVRVHDLRMATTDKHRSVDDTPLGGGAGMVMMPQPLFDVVETVNPRRPLLSLSPAGRRFDQDWAKALADSDGFSLLCGRYEGIDERVNEHLADGELSVGDVVLAGGEIAALLVLEAVGRCVPGVLGNEESTSTESFNDGLLEYPQYTRPAQFREWNAPEVLLSGNHALIADWRHAQALARTIERRPDLIALRGGLSKSEQHLLLTHNLQEALNKYNNPERLK